MRTQPFLSATLILALSAARLPAVDTNAAGPAEQVGSVFGKPITAADIKLTEPIDPTVRFDATDKARWELMGRIAQAFGQPVVERFKTDHKIDATPDEIAAFNKNAAATNARQLREAEEQLSEVKAKLAAPDLPDAERAKLTKRQQTLERSIDSRKDPKSVVASDEMARHFIVNWKTERELLRAYGGQVIFQQFGPEALDGRRLLYEEAEKKGDLKFADPGVRHLFYYYSVNMKHAQADKETLEQPWFLREATEDKAKADKK